MTIFLDNKTDFFQWKRSVIVQRHPEMANFDLFPTIDIQIKKI